MTRARDLSRVIAGNPAAPTAEVLVESKQTDEPYANSFIRFREPDGTTKAVVGFTAETDNTFSITVYEDFRIKLRTGTPGDPASFLNRSFIYGDATSSWVGVSAPAGSAVGGCFIRFTEDDPTETKGIIGFASTSDDDIDILNYVSGGHIDLQTTGTGVVKVRPVALGANGTAAAPSWSFINSPTMGIFRENSGAIGLSVAGVQVASITATGVHLGTSSGPVIMKGAGSPEGAVTAVIGSLYVNTSGGTSTTLYVKTSGDGTNTGWTAK